MSKKKSSTQLKQDLFLSVVTKLCASKLKKAAVVKPQERDQLVCSVLKYKGNFGLPYYSYWQS